MPALDPAGNAMRIDAERLRKTIGGVRAPVVFELHSFQLEVDPGDSTGVSASLNLRRMRSSVIHANRDGIASSGSLQGSSLVGASPNSRAPVFSAQCGMLTFLAKT